MPELNQPNLTTPQLISLAKRLKNEASYTPNDPALIEALRYVLIAAGYSPDAVRLLMLGQRKMGFSWSQNNEVTLCAC